MPVEGCAFVCWIMASCAAILSWMALRTGDMGLMVPAGVCGAVVAGLCVLVLAYKFS